MLLIFTYKHTNTDKGTYTSWNIPPFPPVEISFLFPVTFIFIRALGIWLSPIWSVN